MVSKNFIIAWSCIIIVNVYVASETSSTVWFAAYYLVLGIIAWIKDGK